MSFYNRMAVEDQSKIEDDGREIRDCRESICRNVMRDLIIFDCDGTPSRYNIDVCKMF